MHPGGCDNGRICFLYRDDGDFSDFVPLEKPVYDADDFHGGLSGTDCVQPDDVACREYLCDDWGMFCLRIFPDVGNLRMFFQYSPECDSVRKFLGLLSGHLYRGAGEYPAFGTGDDTDKRLGELALYALVCNLECWRVCGFVCFS